MERFYNPIYLLLSAVVLFASCLESDDNEYELYDDAAIVSFSLTNAKMLMHTTSSTGGDSTYYANTSLVAEYPFSIDHQKGEIFNQDSLPYGVDPSRVLCAYATLNNGMVGLENEVGDTVSYLQTTDTTDFSKPRYLRVYSSDNSVSRRYKVTVNVHKEVADSFRWKRMADASVFAGMQHVRSIVLGNKLVVLGNDGAKTGVYVNETSANDGSWNEAAALGVSASRNAVVKGDTLFVLDGQTLKWSLDAQSFAVVAEATGLKQLVGGCLTELYALGNDGSMQVSKDGGISWTADALDDEASLLPQQDIDYSCSAFSYNADTDYVLLVGNRSVADYSQDSTAMVWRKIVEYAADSKTYKWAFIGYNYPSLYPLPRLAGLQVINYGNSLLAIGGAGIGTCTEAQLTNIYESRDGGITWKTNSIYSLPETLNTSATSFSMTVDKDNFIWIICAGTGEVWRGRLNKMGWEVI